MTPERWAQIKDVLAAAAALEGAARASYLASACAGDADLEQEVASLLDAHAASGGMLDTSAPDRRGAPAAAALVGRRIGAYDLVAELGHGGMADVFAAV